MERMMLKAFFDSILPLLGRGRDRVLKSRESFHRQGFTDCDSLLANYARLSTDNRFVALLVFKHFRTQAALPLLFRELKARDDAIGGVAAAALAAIGGRPVLQRLVSEFKRARLHAHRARILSALCQIDRPSSRVSLARLLMRVLRDDDESVELRATAAEGLANALEGFRRRHPTYREATDLLLNMLASPSDEIRCCSVYSLGQLRVKKAVKRLREVASNDTGHCPGIGRVSDEAREAIQFILGPRSS